MEPNSHNWWSTLPSVITSIAGTLTAITGLIIALDQIGLFKTSSDRLQTSHEQHLSTDPTNTKSEVPKKEDVNTTKSAVVKKEDKGNGSPKEITIDKKTVHLSGHWGIKMRLDILSATLESYDSKNSLLSFRFRILDESGFGLNIMDTYLILSMYYIPMATNNES